MELKEIHRQFAESYARSKKKLTQVEWAKRFKVTKRTIVNWLANEDIKALIEVIRGQIDFAVVDREFVERLTTEERADLLVLLEQQKRIDDEPGSELDLKELKDIMVRKAFRSNPKEIKSLIDFLNDMVTVFEGIEKDRSKGIVLPVKNLEEKSKL